jgi:hypothetical protein
MTTQTLKRQIDRLKIELDAIKPKPESKVTVLIEPAPDSDAETIAAYLDKLAQAKHSLDRVIVVQYVDGARLERENVNGVTYVRHEWEAQMLLLNGQPSERDNVNRLDDVLKNLSGNVMGVVANPPGDVHAGWLGRSA